MPRSPTLLPLVFACAAALGAVPSSAVNLGTDGSGEVLLYPYYTTRNGFVTSFTVVNTSQLHTKSVKVRMREGRAGAQVIDFNVWLPPRDTWSASIIDNGSGGAFYSVDRSCTTPSPFGNVPSKAQPFVNFYYTGQFGPTFNDNGGNGLDRTREGFIEIFEMGVLADGSDGAASPATPVGTELSAALRQHATGSPTACARLQRLRLVSNGSDLREPVGGLTGSFILINSATGVEFAGNPVALQNFYNPPTSNALYADPGEHLPNLGSVTPARSVVLTGGADGQDDVIVTDWTAAGGQPVDAVSAVLMRGSFSSEFDASDGFATDMIVTMPTKAFYVASASAPAAAAPPISAISPFARTFASAVVGGGQSCDQLFSAVSSRATYPSQDIVSFDFPGSACSVATTYVDVCYAATVFPLGSRSPQHTTSLVFGSADPARFTQNTQPLCNAGIGPTLFSVPSPLAGDQHAGWVSFWPMARSATLADGNPGQSVAVGESRKVFVTPTGSPGARTGGLRNLTAGGKRFRGLPLIGFTAIQATLGGQGYGGIFELKYSTNIAP